MTKGFRQPEAVSVEGIDPITVEAAARIIRGARRGGHWTPYLHERDGHHFLAVKENDRDRPVGGNSLIRPEDADSVRKLLAENGPGGES